MSMWGAWLSSSSFQRVQYCFTIWPFKICIAIAGVGWRGFTIGGVYKSEEMITVNKDTRTQTQTTKNKPSKCS